MDNVLIEKLLLDGQFDAAFDVYENGSFSRSYAELTFGFEGIGGAIPAHTEVTGESESGSVVKGMLLQPAKMGAKVVRILYHNADNVGSCFVGGNPHPVVDGCKSLDKELTVGDTVARPSPSHNHAL
jgi:hypothetical protein